MLARPARMLRPLLWLPPQLPESIIALSCSHLLREAIVDGQLDELAGRLLLVELHEPRLDLRFTLERGRVRPAPPRWPPAVTVRAHAADLLLVLDQRVDPDTLFFRRRLQISGDTALGLTVKNLLDGLDTGTLPAPARRLLGGLADIVPAGRRPQSIRNASTQTERAP